MEASATRRQFLRGLAAGGLVLAAPVRAFCAAAQPAEVGPTEDLMREHGVLRRVLLVYEHFSGSGELDA
ncbi:MAG: twin-arginine translocation signal domain-containing protein, partial [Elusimicrobia bacterium]|nr:twin-arginine translocation signal domain-containing protein [Elusimicrobiota bacterium]